MSMNVEKPPAEQGFAMLPLEIVENFIVGDQIIITGKNKKGEKIKESFDSLEKARSWILTEPSYQGDSLEIELDKKE